MITAAHAPRLVWGLDGRFSQYAGVRLCGARLERTQYAGGIRAGDEDRCDASDR